ncbi:peptide/nickel transport system permease protein [Natronoarchaeum philippinense]|uniref:Peptide/nickel transport system permease protein n=1 Tax=Natronoarchaeum philippinense TaxID=558529 RepID=A0A285N4K7_NATPI|nr:ABC transporter permease [Natronoarchaeum philippinense]SNZ02661.1 peptide/nickel transport system permease protein [Natronoarchaeum philippinense]
MSLRRFILKRVLLTVPILLGVSVITFAMVHLTPGDPVDLMVAMNPDISPAEKARLREQYGLNDPIWVQYFSWLTDALQGDFGQVIRSNREVSKIVASRIPATIVLGLFGWVFALLIAIPTGIYAAVRKDQLGDHVSRFAALSGISIPNFWLGLMLILIGSIVLGLWPVLPPREPLYHPEMLWYLLLPGITIGTASASTLMRIMRSSMAEELNKEYVTAAKAKGLPQRTVILKHVLRNSLISVTTVAAFLTANIVAGSVVVEVVFSWPGLGKEFVDAIISREVNLILAITLFTGAAIVLANLLADIVYAMLDPRIRYD